MIFLSCPKSFDGLSDSLQCAAIKSWLAIPGARVVLAGPSADIETVPSHLDVETRVVSGGVWEGKVFGLPFFSDLVASLGDCGDEMVCYLNADMILPSEFSETIIGAGSESKGEALYTGSRWDLSEGVQFSGDTTSKNICDFVRTAQARGHIKLRSSMAMDYFVFPPKLFAELPPLIVGRGGYDNALLAYCFRRAIPVIDVSESLVALHPFHGYDHVPGGKQVVNLGEEAMFNRKRHRIKHSVPTSIDAEFIIRNQKAEGVPWRCGVWRRIELFVRFGLGCEALSLPFRLLQRLFRLDEKASNRAMKLIQNSVLVKESCRENAGS